jgi:hypothetical protein
MATDEEVARIEKLASSAKAELANRRAMDLVAYDELNKKLDHVVELFRSSEGGTLPVNHAARIAVVEACDQEFELLLDCEACAELAEALDPEGETFDALREKVSKPPEHSRRR